MYQGVRLDALRGDGSRCYVCKSLWPAKDSDRLGLGLDKASLLLVTGFITRHCDIR